MGSCGFFSVALVQSFPLFFSCIALDGLNRLYMCVLFWISFSVPWLLNPALHVISLCDSVPIPRYGCPLRSLHVRVGSRPPLRLRLRVRTCLPVYRRPPRWGCLPWKWLRVRRIILTRQHLRSRIFRYITRSARASLSPSHAVLSAFFSPYVRQQLVRLYHTHMRRALPTSGGLPLVNALRVASSYLAGGLPNSGRHRILTALTALERMYSCSKPSCTGGQSSLAPHSFNPVAHSFPNPRYFEHQVSQFCLVHSYNMVCGGPVIDPLHVLSFAVNHILPTSAAQCRWDAGFHPKKVCSPTTSSLLTSVCPGQTSLLFLTTLYIRHLSLVVQRDLLFWSTSPLVLPLFSCNGMCHMATLFAFVRLPRLGVRCGYFLILSLVSL